MGSTLDYICDQGYELVSGTLHRECNASATWEGSPPNCQLVVCPAPAPVPHSVVVVPCSPCTYGSTITYLCNEGYQSGGGNRIRRCEDTRQWSGEPLICTEITCPNPPVIANTAVLFTSITLNAVATYTCSSGYKYMGGKATAVCTSQETWQSADILCEEILCGPPPVFDRATRMVTDERVGSTAVYQCDKGYTLASASTSPGSSLGVVTECLDSGSWSEINISCIAVLCGLPPALPNTRLTHTSTELHSSATYTCLPGTAADVEGWGAEEENVTCTAYGWTSPRLRCVVKDCGAPDEKPFTSLTFKDTTVGQTAKYECLKGYEDKVGGMGTVFATCQENASWTPVTLVCEESTYALEAASFGADAANVTFVNGTDDGVNFRLDAVMRFACGIGHDMTGPTERRLEEGGVWTSQPPTCSAKTCPPPNVTGSSPALIYTASTGGSVSTYLSTVTFGCEDPETWRLVTEGGDRVHVCDAEGQWDGTVPTCVKKQCDAPANITHGAVWYSSLHVHSNATYTCARGYELEPPPESEAAISRCLPDETWSPPPPRCQAVVCHALPPLLGPHMRLHVSSQLYGGVLTYSCADGHTLSSLAGVNQTCNASGQWTPLDQPPQCVPLDCGPPPTVENTTVSATTSTQLGAVARYSCLPNHEHTAGDRMRRCGTQAQWEGEDIQCQYIEGGTVVEIFVPEENLTEAEMADARIGLTPADRRPLAMGVGSTLGIALVTVFVVIIISLDLPAFPQQWALLKYNLSGMRPSQRQPRGSRGRSASAERRRSLGNSSNEEGQA